MLDEPPPSKPRRIRALEQGAEVAEAGSAPARLCRPQDIPQKLLQLRRPRVPCSDNWGAVVPTQPGQSRAQRRAEPSSAVY